MSLPQELRFRFNSDAVGALVSIFAAVIMSLSRARADDAVAQAAPRLLEPWMMVRGKLLFAEDFSGSLSRTNWIASKGVWTVVESALRGVDLADENHAATIRHPQEFGDALIQFSFKFDGGEMLAMTLYDKKGHVSRITIRPDGLLLSKDRPSNKSGQESVELAHTGFDFQRGKWYVVLLELSGDEMFARVDDQHFAYGQATGIGRPKTNFRFRAGGNALWFDNVMVWAASPNPEWPLKKQKLMAPANGNR
jgi:hypothetical protein